VTVLTVLVEAMLKSRKRAFKSAFSATTWLYFSVRSTFSSFNLETSDSKAASERRDMNYLYYYPAQHVLADWSLSFKRYGHIVNEEL